MQQSQKKSNSRDALDSAAHDDAINEDGVRGPWAGHGVHGPWTDHDVGRVKSNDAETLDEHTDAGRRMVKIVPPASAVAEELGTHRCPDSGHTEISNGGGLCPHYRHSLRLLPGPTLMCV